VGFGGRLLGPGEPKYLNSAESAVFSKGRLLYGLNWAKQAARRDERMLVVEGYFDVVRLIGAGIESVVAPMGTALTEEQAKLIRRYTVRVYLLYDSDKAGLKATFRSGDELLRHGCAVRVITLPNGEDPDTFVRANGAAALEQQVSQSVDVFERKIQLLERGGWFAELQKKRRALDKLLPTIRATIDPPLRDLYLKHAAHKVGIQEAILTREVHVIPRDESQSGTQDGLNDQGFSQPVGKPRQRLRREDWRQEKDVGVKGAEAGLVRAMLRDRDRAVQIAERLGPTRFRDAHYRAIFCALLLISDSSATDFIPKLEENLGEEDVAIVDILQEDLDAPIDWDATVSDSIGVIEQYDIGMRNREIDRNFSVASIPEQEEMMMEKDRLRRESGLLGQPFAKSSGKLLNPRRSAPLE
jgi:DNA primase